VSRLGAGNAQPGGGRVLTLGVERIGHGLEVDAAVEAPVLFQPPLEPAVPVGAAHVAVAPIPWHDHRAHDSFPLE